jgi:hypothetical protein
MPDVKPRDLCERTFRFAREIVTFCVELAARPGARRQIAAQLLAAGTSVGANAEDAKAAYSRRAFPGRSCLIEEANQLVAIYTVTVRKSKLPTAPIFALLGALVAGGGLLSSHY